MNVALAQLDPEADLQRDCETACRAIRTRPEFDLVAFPELFLGGYGTEDPGRNSTTIDSPELGAVSAACAESVCAAVIGFTESLGGGRYANSAACFGPDGRLEATYRKTHLFGAGERAAFTAGDSMHVVRLGDRLIGPQICFDVEFPEPARLMTGGGAELLVTISANMEPYAADHRLAARARALDNRLHHLYVNRVGEESGHRFTGESCVIDPGGNVLAELGDEESVLELEFEPAAPAPDTDYLHLRRQDLKVIVQDNANGGEA